MPSAPKMEGGTLILLRSIGVAMLIFLASHAYIGAITGKIEVGNNRNALIMTGENLWLGFLFLLSSATIFVFLLFINHNKTAKFNFLAKIFGGAWFLIFGLCVLSNFYAR